MKYLKVLFVCLCFSVFVKPVFAQKEIFIKQIDFELNRISDIDYENEFFLTMKLNKGTKYVFKITNGINETSGKAVLEVLDADNLILTNIFSDKYYDVVNFQCNKTSFYDILIRFKDKELGNCQVDIVMIQ